MCFLIIIKEFYVNTGVLTDPGKEYSFISKSIMPGGFLMGSFSSYTNLKISEAINKARSTGNIWDFFNYDFFHFYGYSNLDHMWGGENIKWLLYWGFGVEHNGDMSVGNFLLNVLAIIPIGRVASIAGKFLAGFLERQGLKTAINIGKRLRTAKEYLKFLAQKFKLNDPVLWKKFFSVIGDVVLPNPVAIAADFLEFVTKRRGYNSLGVVAKFFSGFEFKRGLGDISGLLMSSNPLKKMYDTYKEVWDFASRNGKYIGNLVKNASKSFSIVKNIVKTVLTNPKGVAKKVVVKYVQIAKKFVTKSKTLKKIVKTSKNIVHKVKSTLHKAVKIVKKATKKVIHAVKKVAKKVVKVVKKVTTKAVKTVKSGINWLKNKIWK